LEIEELENFNCMNITTYR